MSPFVSLHNHTDFSLLRSSSRVTDLVDRAVQLEMGALAITDDGNLFGALEFYKACRAASIRPIIGCDFFLAAESRHNKTAADSGLRASRLVLLAKSDAGYRNLIKLSSIGYTEGFYYRPRIDDEVLSHYSEDLVCLTGSLSGDIPRLLSMNQIGEAERRIDFYREIFGSDSLYLELNDHGLPDQQPLNRALVELGSRRRVPVVAANESYYVLREDSNAHDTLLCIGSNKKKSDESRFRFSTDQFYLKGEQDLPSFVLEHQDAVRNSVRIADQCRLEINLPGPMFPHYEIPDAFRTPEEYLRHLASHGLETRYSSITEELRQRLNYELDTIIGMGFTGYFLIVWDFIRYARENQIPVGPGRGSGPGSLVAYSLKITDIDPLKYGLLFERFLNPDRVNLPDFDIDFCYERRGEVIDYVTRKYGAQRVGQIITFGTLKARAVIRDVARVLDLPYNEADTIAKLVPWELKITLPKALDQVPELQELMDRGGVHGELIETSMRLEGLHRHASTHAAGIVIGPDELTRYVPLYRDAKTGQVTTQYTMDQLEDCGLVKMDFLGLKTLTLIENTRALMRESGNDVDLDTVREDDPETFELLSQGHSRCVFQFESSGMTAVLKRARPNRIEDLIALVSLYRPGPMENIDQFVNAKNGRTPIVYPLPQLERALKETYGVIIYQEQVMEIVQIVAGFSLGQADILRRAMGKKKVGEMSRMKVAYLEGASALGVSRKDAESIFTLLEPFAGYGFNKPHAASYAVLAYKTAYLKAHHPVEFMAANLTNEVNDSDKFAEYMGETRNMGIEVKSPEINISEKYFSVRDGHIIYGLVGVKNVGSAAVDAILEERRKGGRFESFIDFAERIDPRVVNRKVIETFVACGLFDSLGQNRGVLTNNLDRAMEFTASRRAARQSGQVSLFEGTDDAEFVFDEADPWTQQQKLNVEKENLGFYFSGHPLDAYRELCADKVTLDLSRAERTNGDRVHRLIGLVKGVHSIQTRKGTRMAFAVLEDFSGSIELVFFSECYEQNHEAVVDDAVIAVEGKVDTSRDRTQFVVEKVLSPERLPDREDGEVHVRIAQTSEEDLYHLRAFLFDRPGGCSVYLHISSEYGESVVRASEQLMVSAQRNVITEIEEHPHVLEVWKQ